MRYGVSGVLYLGGAGLARSYHQRPALTAELNVHEAIEEGARVIFQAAPTRIMTDAKNTVTGVEFQRMKLGEPDAQGRRRPEPMPGTEFIVECDTVLGAIGQGPDLSWVEAEPEEIRSKLAISRRGTLEAEEHIFRTNLPKVFASGDVRTGAATVVEASSTARARGSASSGTTPSRPIPVSTHRWTFNVPPVVDSTCSAASTQAGSVAATSTS